jgi:hypothetical protein
VFHDRRSFLQRLTVGSVALGSLPSVLGAAEPDSARAEASTYDEWRALEQPPAKLEFDVSWTQKLTGKYRAVFDTPAINGGGGVWRAGAWVGHYKDVIKAAPADINPVIVIRHAGIPLIMNHEFWDRYDIAKEEKVRHPMTDKKTKRNPVLMTAEDDQLPPPFANMALHKQIERGVTVLGCNNAFGGMVAMVAKKEKLGNAEARAQALTMMVPGVILQPNGIFGVTLAQHNGCVFVAAS